MPDHAVQAPGQVVITPLLGIPAVRAGDDLAALLAEAVRGAGLDLVAGDIVVVSSKVVSKALGLTAPASQRPALIERGTVRVVAERRTSTGVTRIVQAVAGPVLAGAGVDASNTGGPAVVLALPDDPDACARELRHGIQQWYAACAPPAADSPAAHAATEPLRIAVLITDTAGRPWRDGQTDFALGAAGVLTVDDLRGASDTDGVELKVTVRAVADELAAAADLVKGKVAGVPAAHVRGLGHLVLSSGHGAAARDLVRPPDADWFAAGHAEAVRAALGVPPGSVQSASVGIASVEPEAVRDRAARALRVALADPSLHAVSGVVTGHGDATVLDLTADTRGEATWFVLGYAAARLVVALAGEELAARLDHPFGPTSMGAAASATCRVVLRLP